LNGVLVEVVRSFRARLGDGKNRADSGADACCANDEGSNCGESGALEICEIEGHEFVFRMKA